MDSASPRLDPRSPYNFAPLFGVGNDKCGKFSGGKWKHSAPKFGYLCYHLRIGNNGVDLPIERIDDFGWRFLGRCDTEPETSLKPWQKLTHGRHVRERWRTRR